MNDTTRTKHWTALILGCLLIAPLATAGPPYKDPADTSMTVVTAGTTEDEDPDPEISTTGDPDEDSDAVEFEVNPQVTCLLAPLDDDPDPDVKNDQEIMNFLTCAEQGLSQQGYLAQMWRDENGDRDPSVGPSVSVRNDNGTPIEDLRVIEHDDDIQTVSIRLDRGTYDSRPFRAEIGEFVKDPAGDGVVQLIATTERTSRSVSSHTPG